MNDDKVEKFIYPKLIDICPFCGVKRKVILNEGEEDEEVIINIQHRREKEITVVEELNNKSGKFEKRFFNRMKYYCRKCKTDFYG